MIVGIDIDGTITASPRFFAHLSNSLVVAGHTVLIITFRPDSKEDIATDLRRMGISWSQILTMPNQRCSLQEFITWKAQVCRIRKVDIFFEDMPDVAAAVEPPTVVMVPLSEETREKIGSIDWSTTDESV